MALSREDRAYLEGLGVENVRQRLAHAGPGGLDVAPALGRSGSEMTRSDVEVWLFEKDQATQQLQLDILWWAKAAALIAALGIAVMIVIAIVQH
jgi:hypothetical protein